MNFLTENLKPILVLIGVVAYTVWRLFSGNEDFDPLEWVTVVGGIITAAGVWAIPNTTKNPAVALESSVRLSRKATDEMLREPHGGRDIVAETRDLHENEAHNAEHSDPGSELRAPRPPRNITGP